MSEKCPRAFGIFTPDGWWEILYADNHTANLDANHKYECGDFTGCEVVELIPLPEHQAIVAAAVAAAVERCAGISKQVGDEISQNNRSYLDAFEKVEVDTAELIERRIREVPE